MRGRVLPLLAGLLRANEIVTTDQLPGQARTPRRSRCGTGRWIYDELGAPEADEMRQKLQAVRNV
ncbi:hypothetical protein [Lentzea atacamensis]|uniref:hypothetical protein n=1 Tax=Lentzea atacamensis TaxID=531938 RepID=UPI000DD39BB3|nr:hypothetical protein [Lentzea atacamensis]